MQRNLSHFLCLRSCAYENEHGNLHDSCPHFSSLGVQPPPGYNRLTPQFTVSQLSVTPSTLTYILILAVEHIFETVPNLRACIHDLDRVVRTDPHIPRTLHTF